MNLKALIRSSAVYTFGNLINRGTGFLLLPIYTRYLLPQDYGTMELIDMVINIAGMLFGMNALGNSMIRVYHEYSDQKERESVIFTAIISILFISILMFIIGSFASPFLSHKILGNSSMYTLFMLSFLAIIFGNQVEMSLTYLRIQDKPAPFVIYSYLQVLGLIGFNVFFIVYMKLGIFGFIYSKLICMGLGSVFLGYLVVNRLHKRFHWQALKKMVRFGLPLVGATLAFFIIHFSDRFFLSKYGTLADVGIYSLGYKFGFLITYLVGEPFGRAWNARLFSHVGEEGWKIYFSKVFSLLVIALSFACTIIGFFSGDLLRIMVSGPFRTAAIIIPGVAFGYVLREIGDFFREILFINHKTGSVTKIAILSAVLNLILNYFLIQKWGMMGAMYSTMATWLLYALFLLILSQREFSIPYKMKGAFPLFIIICIGFYFARKFDAFSLPFSILGHGILVIPILLGYWFLGFLDSEQKEFIVTKLKWKSKSIP